MTREQAIYELQDVVGDISDSILNTLELREACDMAIKALEAEPCEDCISRQAVLDTIDKLKFNHYFERGEYIGEDTVEIEIVNADRMRDTVEDLPSVAPARKKGKWIKKNCDLLYCSECDLPSMHPWPYCERCGAEMRGEENET